MENKVLVVSGCIIEKDKKFLLVQEAKDFCYGSWNFPQGRLLDDNLSIPDNAIKEAKEETGYDVEIEGLVGIYQYFKKRNDNKNNIIIFVFKAHIVGGDIEFDKKEILDVKWFDLDEFQKLKQEGKYRWKMMENVAKDYLDGKLYKVGDLIKIGEKTYGK